MAAMTIEPRDPEMSHFIDQYKFERQMAERRDKFGGGTSLPLNSDGYEDRQRFLKEERHREWAEHQEREIGYKPTINPYPHPKLSRGPQNRTSYDIEIQRMTDRYHNRYDNVLVKGDEQQRKIEQERIEQRRRNRPPPAQPQTNQIDYNEARELANTEDRRAYQDYQGKITMPIEGRAHIKPPISYEENRKVLAEERKHEYALYQEKKAKEERYRAMRGRPITPPGGGLDVGQYDRQVKETKAQKTKEYRDMLDQQQKEQMMLRAQRDTEMSVIDRQRMSDSQYVASKPPAGPAFKQRDEAFQTNTHARPRSRGTDQSYIPSLSDAPVRGQFYDDRSRPPLSELQPPNSPRRRTPPPRTPPPRRREFEDDSDQFKMQPRSPRRRSPPPRTPVGSERLRNQNRSPRRRTPPLRPPPASETGQSDKNSSHMSTTDLSPRRRKALEMDESQYDKMRKTANLARQEDYKIYLKEKEDERRRQLSNRTVPKPAAVVKGPYYSSDNYETYQAELRRKQIDDYKEYLQKTRPAPKNRGWKESDSGLLLPEDHSMEYKKRELQNERKKEYQEHLAQKKAPPNHFWPEPEPGRGALWLKKAEYDGVRQMYDEERKKEFAHSLEKKQQQQEISQSPRPKSEPPNTVKNGYINPMVESMGRYEMLRQKLREIRRKDFVDFMDKAKPHWSERRYGDQPPSLARDEKPLVYSMGKYDNEQLKKVREEAHKDLAEYYEEQRKNMSPRRLEKELPHLATAEDPFVNYLGNYAKEREKFAIERHKDFCDFSEKYQQQHHSPWKNYVYPLNAHLEHPVIEKMGHGVDEKKRQLRDERKRDYERYLSEQRKNEVPRRDDYGRNVEGPYNGMFHGLGEHGGNKDELSQQRRQEYNDRLDQQYSQREKPTGRPSWAKDPVTDQEFGDRGRSPLKSPTKQDHYEQMLHEKRREEAQRRRYDDPEYQEKLARMDSRERGPARDQPRYGY